jgi:hypothetical protein
MIIRKVITKKFLKFDKRTICRIKRRRESVNATEHISFDIRQFQNLMINTD